MAAVPEPLRGWSRANSVGGEDSSLDEPASVMHRVAFIGRTSTADLQDPTLSIPRQYSSCEVALPDDAILVASFYDIESGRKDLAVRGYSDAHEQFAIPVFRDGGIQDLLVEAERSGRRFDYVICESIERISRRTHTGTNIEHRLERVGVRLLAADEPFTLTSASHHRKQKVATQVLTRRVKQGVAEFYVLEMLEKSWDGFAVHTEAGFNVGKACYGYQAKLVQHPVPAKRAKGQKKTRLEPDIVRVPVVQTIFRWRCGERLSYQEIADRLNTDLVSNPAPVPVNPESAVGHWTWSSVRGILTNPKYTGHMVWNRRGRKSNQNRVNPVSEWVWSPQPVHEAIIDIEMFLAAQEIAAETERSRSAPGLNPHPQTKRSYFFRSYLRCDHCGRRMFGKTRKVAAYYVCAPKKDYTLPGHPTGGSFFVREADLLRHLNTFLNSHVFGQYRRSLLEDNSAEANAKQERERRTSTLRKGIVEAGAKMKRLVRSLELVDEPDREFIADVNERRAELRKEQAKMQAELEELEAAEVSALNPELIELLPIGYICAEEMPDSLARTLFDALRLEVRYSKSRHRVTYRVTLVADTVAAAKRAAAEALVAGEAHNGAAGRGGPALSLVTERDHRGPICSVPPAGIEPAT